MWLVLAFIDNFYKLFQYAWFIFIPIIILVIFLLIKKSKLNKAKKINKYEIDKISKSIKYLVVFCVIALFSVRVWGPHFYKIVISLSISGKQNVIEEKLEKKYGRNFTYVSQDRIYLEKDSGRTLGQNVIYDYSVIYYFKDDDGVVAIVYYKKDYHIDYYETKRSKYDIEQAVYDYAKEVNFDKEFYVYVESRYAFNDDAELDGKPSDNFILDERLHDYVHFVLTEDSEENKTFIIDALSRVYPSKNYVSVYEHVVSKSEYDEAVKFYDSMDYKHELNGEEYEEDFDYSDNVIYKYYYID